MLEIIDNKSQLGKWDYSGASMVCYADPLQESYKKAAAFLGDTVEDWGCGTGWSKKHFKNYRGVDGSVHKNVDEVVDLVKYTSDVDNILMRQVLECNPEWKQILDNVKASFKKKFCLIVFTPFVDKTRLGPDDPVHRADGSRVEGATFFNVYFKKQDILDYFPSPEFTVNEEEVKTNQGFKRDWILYVERNT